MLMCRDLLADGAGSRPDAGRISDPNAIKHDAGGGHTFVQVCLCLGCWRLESVLKPAPLHHKTESVLLGHSGRHAYVRNACCQRSVLYCAVLCLQGAVRVPVTDAESAAVLMARAAEARACEATAMNAVSSRSHCVFMLYIAASHAATNTNLTGSLCLVDLAGRWVWVLFVVLACPPCGMLGAVQVQNDGHHPVMLQEHTVLHAYWAMILVLAVFSASHLV